MLMKFKYKIMCTDGVRSWRGSVAELNKMGKAGWELVSVIYVYGESEWIFKRCITTTVHDSKRRIGE